MKMMLSKLQKKTRIQKTNLIEKINNECLPLIPNGNKLIGYHKNTCSFDAFAQCFLNANNKIHLQNQIPLKNDVFSKMILKLLNFDIASALKYREECLYEIFGIDKNCFTASSTVPNYVLKKHPSMTVVMECPACSWIFNDLVRFIPLNENKLDDLGLEYLMDCLTDSHPKLCEKCNIFLEKRQETISDTIFFYVEPFRNNRTIFLKNIPKEITIGEKYFTLNSFVDFIPGLIEDANHYVSYCFKNEKWEKFDDYNTIVVKIRNEIIKVTPHVLVYTSKNIAQ